MADLAENLLVGPSTLDKTYGELVPSGPSFDLPDMSSPEGMANSQKGKTSSPNKPSAGTNDVKRGEGGSQKEPPASKEKIAINNKIICQSSQNIVSCRQPCRQFCRQAAKFG